MTRQMMRAWVVDQPGPIDTGPLIGVEKAIPIPGAGQVRLRSLCAGSVGPTSTSLKVTSSPTTPRSYRVTRWWASSIASGPRAPD